MTSRPAPCICGCDRRRLDMRHDRAWAWMTGLGYVGFDVSTT